MADKKLNVINKTPNLSIKLMELINEGLVIKNSHSNNK
jgi:hypothetical protein